MLAKNILRSIRLKPFQFLSIVILIAMASFISVTLEGAISSVEYFLSDYTQATNQEDFFVVLSAPTTQDIEEMIQKKGVSISAFSNQSKSELMSTYNYSLIDYYEDRVATLEEDFNATLEGRFYRDVTTQVNGQTFDYRLIRETDSVNLTYVLAGHLPLADNEVAIFKNFATSNNLQIGDELTLSGQSFYISGFIAVPDYIYPIFNYDNPLYEASRETLAIVTETAYEKFEEKQWILYSGRFNEEIEDLETTVSQISAADGVSYAMSKDVNVRISTVNIQLSGNQVLSITFTTLLLLMSIFVILLVMKKRINAERIQIGVLKALGYRRMQIAFNYVSYPLLAGTLGSLIGFFLGIGTSVMLSQTYMTSYIVPWVEFYFTKNLIFSGIIYPIFLILLSSFVILLILLKDEPLKLMKENSNLKVSRSSKGLMKLLKPFKFETRFKYSLAFRNIGKILSLFIVVLIASIFLVFASMAYESVENIIAKAFKGANYSYQVKYSKLIDEQLSKTETPFIQYTAYPLIDGKTTSFYLYGIDAQNSVNPLYNEAGEEITILANEGILINEFIARAYGLEIGDNLTLEVKGKQLTYPISGIVDHYNGPMLYMSLTQLQNDLNINSEMYNGKWTSVRPHSTSQISYIFSIEDLTKNIEVGMEMIRITLMIIVVVAMVLGSIMMILITTFIIDENQKQISILKVMGYKEQEISKMILTIYFPFVMIAYALSIPMTRVGVDYIMTLIASELPMAIPTDFTSIQIFGGALIVVITYLLALRFSKRQLDKISLHEVLKY